MTETRAIYDKAIYHRLQQMDRKVYQRARNVLPTDEPTQTKYTISNVVLKDAGEGYDSTFTITIPGETDAVLTCTVEDAMISEVAITEGGVFAADGSGDFTVTEHREEGHDAVLTLTYSEIA